jgi:hypothetical protein
LFDLKCIHNYYLIIGSDLNFTTRREEIWGPLACKDKLAHFFVDKLESTRLVDVEPIKLSLTWSNNRSGEEGVSKRLDRFLVHHKLLLDIGLYCSWVGSVCCLDHVPIFLELGRSEGKPSSPFKYSSTWVELEEFRNLIQENWTPYQSNSNIFPSVHLVSGLRRLKEKVST